MVLGEAGESGGEIVCSMRAHVGFNGEGEEAINLKLTNFNLELVIQNQDFDTQSSKETHGAKS